MFAFFIDSETHNQQLDNIITITALLCQIFFLKIPLGLEVRQKSVGCVGKGLVILAQFSGQAEQTEKLGSFARSNFNKKMLDIICSDMYNRYII